jgi:peptidoglycan glycosyltransferase
LRSDPGLPFRFGRRPRNRRVRRSRGQWSIARSIAAAVACVSVFGLALLAGLYFRAPDKKSEPALPVVSSPPPFPSIAESWIADPPRSRERFSIAREEAAGIDPSAVPRLVEWLEPIGVASYRRRGHRPPAPPSGDSLARGQYRVEYTLDEKLTENVFKILRRGRVERGEAIVLDPRSGRLLAYVSTDPDELPPDRVYPAASIVKILTAATLLQEAPSEAERPCRYHGNKYRLNYRRLARPTTGNESTLEKAIATSNNQCFSQWAVHVLGEEKLRKTFERFGWFDAPAPGHAAGEIESATTKLALGRLGSGLDGIRINPLHVASLASVLTHGKLIEPWWIDRIVDSSGRSLDLPARPADRSVLPTAVADRLRSMMVATTTSGTAKRAFRKRRGQPLIPGIEVAGKTGNLTGGEPFGRYEWFLGLAPAKNPTIAVVVLQLQSNLWWARSSELAANILQGVFCEGKRCLAQLSNRWTGDLGDSTAPLLVSDLERHPRISRVD